VIIVDQNIDTSVLPGLDIREELHAAPLGRFHIQLGVLLACVLFFDGYDLYTASYIVHGVAGPWGLSSGQIGLMLSSGLAGFAAGSAVSGLFGDRLGRRTVLLAGVWISGLFSLLIAVGAQDFRTFMTLRLMMGVALGLLMPMAITYINEIAPRKQANVFTIVFFSLGWIGGATSTGFIAAWLTPRYGWHSLYWVGSLSVLLALLLQFVLPESVCFLASRKRWTEVQALMGRFWPARADTYRTAKLVLPDEAVRRGSVRSLLIPSYRRQTIGFWIMGALSLFASYGLSGWLPTIMLRRGENLSTSFAYGSLLVGASAFGSLFTGLWADRVRSRRQALSLAWCFGAVSIAMLVSPPGGWVTEVSVIVAGMFVIGPQTVLNNLVAVSYPTEIRSTGVGIFLGLSRVGAMLGPAIAGMLQQWTGDTHAMFVVIGLALLTDAAVVWLVVRSVSIADAPVMGH
jgi:MFS transporter, AAHS family, 4-hydroxybenzoate transporter